MTEKATLGILFVHGIGNQLKGETLVNYGEPFLRFLEKWFEYGNKMNIRSDFQFNKYPTDGLNDEFLQRSRSRDLQMQAEINNEIRSYPREGAFKKDMEENFGNLVSDFRPFFKIEYESVKLIDDKEHNPPHVKVNLYQIENENEFSEEQLLDKITNVIKNNENDCDSLNRREGWIFAEAFWANEFHRPHHAKVIFWLIRITPWLVSSYFAERIFVHIEKQKSGFLQKMVYLLKLSKLCLYLVLSILLTPFYFVAYFCLLLLSIIPVSFVDAFVDKTLNALSSILGDSYVFGCSVLRQEAIISKIEESLSWLEDRCEKIVVVGHSQGAATSYLTIRKLQLSNAKIFDKISLFLSVGSGVKKLIQLKDDFNWKKKYIDYFNFFLYLISISLIILDVYMEMIKDAKVMIFAVLILPFIFVYFSKLLKNWQNVIENWNSEFNQLEKAWVDIYASRDPVPNGNLFSSQNSSNERPTLNEKSIEVMNENSVILDHTTYQNNIEEFQLGLAGLLSMHNLTEMPLLELTSYDGNVVCTAKSFRRMRKSLIRINRYLLNFSTLFFLANYSVLSSIGVLVNSMIEHICIEVGFEYGTKDSELWNDSSYGLYGIVAVMLSYIVLNRFFISHLSLIEDEEYLKRLVSRDYSSSFSSYINRNDWAFFLFCWGFLNSIYLLLNEFINMPWHWVIAIFVFLFVSLALSIVYIFLKCSYIKKQLKI